MNEPRPIARQHPIFSPVALVASAVLLLGLGASLLVTGGRAFSPGELSAQSTSGAELGGFASHADFADECRQCHQPLQGVNTTACLTCHEDLGARVAADRGFHASAAAAECSRCHSEHDGLDHDLQAAALASFSREDHAMTYTLHGAHLRVECVDCHANNAYLNLDSSCAACHKEPAEHAGVYGSNCSNCHTEEGWEPAGMRIHAFPIDHGVGVDLPCSGCHLEETTFTTNSCVGCHEHALDLMTDIHAALDLDAAELLECVACHSEGTPAETERLSQELLEN